MIILRENPERPMAGKFTEIVPGNLVENVFNLVGEEWMLITAGNPEHFNTMTASWGTLGILWHLPVAICFIRPQRYTFEFAEASGYYTLSFLQPGNRDILDFCGTKSGRDTDKIKETGLNPLVTKRGNIYYEQCRLVLECRKLYADRIREEEFIIPDLIRKNYPRKDFHKFYIGEVVSCLAAE
jgi:flavin reductase (DIM6/NTAB) family NADH-FMN oxidoreductase RutF